MKGRRMTEEESTKVVPLEMTGLPDSKRSKTGARREHYEEIKRENSIFTEYYRKQGIISEEEWPQFLATLQQNLPITFRLTGHRDEAESISRQLRDTLLPSIGAIARPLTWYNPEGYAWHLDTDRKSMRTQETYSNFHKWLIAATENGDISRQEAVSMIPPLLLDVKADHIILDMCAAPGSKTAQIVEMMHADAQKEERNPTGIVIANDADQQRAYLLYHQVKRILSPSLLVTNNDGTAFPTLVELGNESTKRILFDRILVDVPCSGDGTLRKNANLWRTWTPNLGLGLHPLQMRLLEKAIRLLKVGGRMVYSTCSMNVVENEAVLAHILHKYRHAIQLVDVSDALNGFIRRPGMTTWKVINKEGIEFDSFEQVPPGQRKRFPASVFPLPDYAELHLERCLRIYPHLQDTGGFFVAVLTKTADIDPPKEPTTTTDNVITRAPVKRKFGVSKAEGEFRYLDVATDAVLQNIFDWFGIDKDKMIEDGFGFLVRSERDPIRVISIISPRLQPIFRATVRPHRQSPGEEAVCYNSSLKLVNAGVRAFELYESTRPMAVDCPYRLLTESIDILRPYITKRVGVTDKATIRALLDSPDSIKMEVSDLSGQGGAILETQNEKGKCVCIPVWMSERGIKAFVPNHNRPALRLQLE